MKTKNQIPKWPTETMELADLAPAPYNPRRIKTKNRSALGASIHEFGLVQPLVWNRRTKHLVAGHQRIAALTSQGVTHAEVVVVDLPVVKEKALNVALNSPLLQGEFTDDLGPLLADLDLDGLGDALRMDDLLSVEGIAPDTLADTEIPEPPKKPRTKPGDLWVIGDQRILCGDSTKAENVARLCGDDKAVLMATDPPYGVDYAATKNGIPGSGFRTQREDWGDITGDALKDKALQAMLESAFRAAAAHALLPNAAWYLWHAHLTQAFFAAAAAAANVILHRQIIWRKPHMVLTRSGQYHWRHEPCFYGWVKGHQPPWYGTKTQTSVWEVGRVEDRVHQTQKPIELFAIPIRNHTRKGERCYEPFSGSGTQLVAAQQLERRCAAVEIEPRFVDVAIQRLEALGLKAMRKR